MNKYNQNATDRRKAKLLWNLPAKVQRKFQWDDESIYSFTHLQIADELAQIMRKYISADTHLLDATAGTGGNTIGFARHFQYITAIESDENRFNMLKNNLSAAGINSVDCINCQYQHAQDSSAEAVFFDPPWGGPGYKDYEPGTLRLTLPGDRPTSLEDLIMNLPTPTEWCIIKLPINYDFDHLAEMTAARWSEIYRGEWSKPNSHVIIIFRDWTKLEFSDC